MKRNFLLIAILALTGLAFTAAYQPQGLEVGDTAPDFDLPATDGETYSLATITDANGNKPKGYIVTFTCNTCPYAVANEDRLIELHNEYSPKGWPVVAIQPNEPTLSPGNSMEKMKVRAGEKGFPFLYLMDDGQKIYPQYGAQFTPHVFLLNADRETLYIGAIDDSPRNPESVNDQFVRDAIDAYEAGQEINPSFTKAVGCAIKAS